MLHEVIVRLTSETMRSRCGSSSRLFIFLAKRFDILSSGECYNSALFVFGSINEFLNTFRRPQHVFILYLTSLSLLYLKVLTKLSCIIIPHQVYFQDFPSFFYRIQDIFQMSRTLFHRSSFRIGIVSEFHQFIFEFQKSDNKNFRRFSHDENESKVCCLLHQWQKTRSLQIAQSNELFFMLALSTPWTKNFQLIYRL